MSELTTATQIARFAERLAAIGTEPRLRVLHLLLTAYPNGIVAGAISEKHGIPASTLSHHLELRHEDLVKVHRECTCLRYSAGAGSLRQLLAFLCAECRSRSQAVELRDIVPDGAAGKEEKIERNRETDRTGR